MDFKALALGDVVKVSDRSAYTNGIYVVAGSWDSSYGDSDAGFGSKESFIERWTAVLYRIGDDEKSIARDLFLEEGVVTARGRDIRKWEVSNEELSPGHVTKIGHLKFVASVVLENSVETPRRP